jgi:DNA-binding NarL/FixJ family response regulator
MKNGRIIVVEDDAFTRTTLTESLNHTGLKVVASVGTAREAIAAQIEFAPDAAVLDLDLGTGPTGIDLAHAFRAHNPEIGIIILTSFRDPRLANPNLPALPGGSIFLNKRELESIQALAIQISVVLVNPLTRRPMPWNKNSYGALSNTQIEIMKAIADGYTTSEIAKQRDVSEQAIEKTISRICANLEIPKSVDKNQRVQIVRAFFFGAGREI